MSQFSEYICDGCGKAYTPKTWSTNEFFYGAEKRLDVCAECTDKMYRALKDKGESAVEVLTVERDRARDEVTKLVEENRKLRLERDNLIAEHAKVVMERDEFEERLTVSDDDREDLIRQVDDYKTKSVTLEGRLVGMETEATCARRERDQLYDRSGDLMDVVLGLMGWMSERPHSLNDEHDLEAITTFVDNFPNEPLRLGPIPRGLNIWTARAEAEARNGRGPGLVSRT